MKRFYLPIILLFVWASMLNSQAPIYVNHAATGANNGSSWADAYKDLQNAIDDSSSPDIWIAGGTYLPGAGSADTMSAFYVTRPVNIVGGFDGTEIDPDDRNTVLNKTILSGDLNGDDVVGENEMNRDDNVLHVMVIDSSADMVTLDAIILSGGANNSFDSGLDFFYRAGAGIFSEATTMVTNCEFTGNIGGSGSGLLIQDSGGSGSIIQNTRFHKNTAYNQAAFMMLRTSDIEVKECDFTENQINRGAIYPNLSSNISITNCSFSDNINPGGFGGAMFNWQSVNVDLVGCSFTNNLAANAGAIYSDHRNFPIDQQDADNFLVKDCFFEGNVVSDWGGGAIRAASSSIHLLNTSFLNNRAANTGGAFVASNGPKRVLITDCSFVENEAGGGWGGGIAIYGDTTYAIIKNTVFKKNDAITSGGGATHGFGADITYEDCLFESNTARFGAGMYSQDDYTNVTVKGNTYLTNVAEDNGGGVLFSGGQQVTIDDAIFEGNQANFGGGLGMTEDSLDLATLNMTNTIFNFNVAGTQGGANNIGNTNTNITSCLYVNNVANDVGTGGAVSTNASGPNDMNISIMNSTMADNSGSLGAGIVTWTADTTNAFLFIQNTALVNGFEANYAIEEGNTAVQSNGGNFSDNTTTDNIFTHSTDVNNSPDEPMFVDARNFDYHIEGSSPFVDKGVASGAPLTDLDGNMRVGNIDIGAYEYTWPVSTGFISLEEINISLTPNPVFAKTTLEIDNDWTGEFAVDLIDVSGKVVKQYSFSKSNGNQNFSLRVDDLQKGIYVLVISQGEKSSSTQLIKF